MNKQLKMMVWTASIMLVLSMAFAACNNKKSKSEADDEDEDETELAEEMDDEDMDDEEESDDNTIDVRTARELIEALRSNVHINVITNDMLRMTDAIDELIEEGKLKRYDVNLDPSTQAGIYWDEVYDGNTIHIVGLKNVVIEGVPEDGGFLLAIPRYADVLSFEGCENIVIKNLTLGHEETGNCEGDVLKVCDCDNVTIEECRLFGCGVNGMYIYLSSKIAVKNTDIYGCSDRGADMYYAKNVSFDHCEIFNNGTGIYVDPYCTNISFNHCKLQDIKGQMFLCYAPVDIRNSKIEHHHDDIKDNVNFTNCDVVMDYSQAEEYPDFGDDE